jgi:ferredoxin
LHLARLLAQHLGLNQASILPLEFTDPNQLTSDEHLVLLYPIHGFNAPRTVKRFVKNLPSGRYGDVSLIGVGCTNNWVNQAVSADLRKLLAAKGYPVILDEILGMPLTFVMAFPDAVARKSIADSEQRVKEISKQLLDGTKSDGSETVIEFKSRLLNFVGKIEPLASRMFGPELHANSQCNSCGICWKNCPSGNIKSNAKGLPKFGFSCLMCMRCIYNCPTKAISPRFSKFLPIKNGYSLKQYLKPSSTATEAAQK